MSVSAPFPGTKNKKAKYSPDSCTLSVVLGPGALISSKSLLETEIPGSTQDLLYPNPHFNTFPADTIHAH